MLHLAAGLVETWGLGLPGEAVRWRNDAAVLACAGLSGDGCREALGVAQAAFVRVTGLKWADAA
jgi:hypothetical protein